jgi:hypothetical protein
LEIHGLHTSQLADASINVDGWQVNPGGFYDLPLFLHFYYLPFYMLLICSGHVAHFKKV